MGPDDIPLLLTLPFLVVLSGLASGSETALFGMTPADRARLAAERPAAAEALGKLLSKPRRLLVTVLLVNTAVNVAYFVLVSVLVMRAEDPATAAILSLGSLLAIVLFGEIFAKLVATTGRLRLAGLLAVPASKIAGVLRILAVPLDVLLVAPVTRLLVPSSPPPDPVTPDEFGALLEHAAGDGAIDSSEHGLLTEVIALGEVRVREVMTPRLDLPELDLEDDLEPQIAQLCAKRHVRVPAIRGSFDSGIAGWFDLRIYLTDGEGGGIEDRARRALKPAHAAPESARLDQALETFRAKDATELVCVDEHGLVTGALSLSVVLDQLLGKQELEEDADQSVRLVGIGAWSVPGRLPIRSWAKIFTSASTPLLEHGGRVSTVAGLVLAKLGRIPEEGDACRVGPLKLVAEEVSGRAVQRVRIELFADEQSRGSAQEQEAAR